MVVPSAAIVSGAVYLAHTPPLSEYEVVATPAPVSVAVRVTSTLLVYQPLEPKVPVVEARVVGGVRSGIKILNYSCNFESLFVLHHLSCLLPCLFQKYFLE